MPKLKRPPDRYESLKEKLRGRMAARDMTLADLGVRMGRSDPTVRSRLRHPETITLGELRTMFAALDIQLEEGLETLRPILRR